MSIKQFDIWIADLNPGKGTVPGKIRPVVVVQANGLNKVGHPSTIICPLTSDMTIDSKLLRINICPNTTNGLAQDSAVLVDQIRAVDNLKIIKRLGSMEEKYHDQLKDAIIKVLDLS
ncbi:MAG: type II toxin-antitoxin system PemK/MazF family toxin [Janthinobacterium lividum]